MGLGNSKDGSYLGITGPCRHRLVAIDKTGYNYQGLSKCLLILLQA